MCLFTTLRPIRGTAVALSMWRYVPGCSISTNETHPFLSMLLQRLPNKHNTVYGANVIIFEGIFGLYDKKVLDMMVTWNVCFLTTAG